jgi:hypothetical protein
VQVADLRHAEAVQPDAEFRQGELQRLGPDRLRFPYDAGVSPESQDKAGSEREGGLQQVPRIDFQHLKGPKPAYLLSAAGSLLEADFPMRVAREYTGRPMAAEKIGLIAGNGSFPLLVLEAARTRGLEVVVAAIREETVPEIEEHGAASVHWLSLGELSKLIEILKREGVRRAVMAGQVKHKQIFSSIRPDWRLAKLLLSLTTRNTDSLIGAVAKVLNDEGITLMNSTELLEPLLACAGVSTRPAPSEMEPKDVE